MKYLSMLVVLFIPTVAYAEEAGETMPDVQSFFGAIQEQHWPLVVAIGLMFVVWILRRFVKDKVPPKALPYIALTIAVLGTTASRMIQFINAGTTWWHGMIQGILEGATIGFSAMGMWSSGGKKLPTPKKE